MNRSLATMALLSGLSDDNVIPYRKTFNKVTGGITASILLQQFIYRFSRNGFKKFYKFKNVCGHTLYTDGDDWLDELGFTRAEFDTALSKIATKVKTGVSKSDVMNRRDVKSMIVYWTDSDRVTWYDINIEAITSVLLPLYIELEVEDDFSDLFGDTEIDNAPVKVKPMDALGVTARTNAKNSGVGELLSLGWTVRSQDVADIIVSFHEISGMEYPSSADARAKWRTGSSSLLEEFGAGVSSLMKKAWNEYLPDIMSGRLDITHPMALKTKMIAINSRDSLKITTVVEDVVKDSDGGMYL